MWGPFSLAGRDDVALNEPRQALLDWGAGLEDRGFPGGLADDVLVAQPLHGEEHVRAVHAEELVALGRVGEELAVWPLAGLDVPAGEVATQVLFPSTTHVDGRRLERGAVFGVKTLDGLGDVGVCRGPCQLEPTHGHGAMVAHERLDERLGRGFVHEGEPLAHGRHDPRVACERRDNGPECQHGVLVELREDPALDPLDEHVHLIEGVGLFLLRHPLGTDGLESRGLVGHEVLERAVELGGVPHHLAVNGFGLARGQAGFVGRLRELGDQGGHLDREIRGRKRRADRGGRQLHLDRRGRKVLAARDFELVLARGFIQVGELAGAVELDVGERPHLECLQPGDPVLEDLDLGGRGAGLRLGLGGRGIGCGLRHRGGRGVCHDNHLAVARGGRRGGFLDDLLSRGLLGPRGEVVRATGDGDAQDEQRENRAAGEEPFLPVFHENLLLGDLPQSGRGCRELGPNTGPRGILAEFPTRESTIKTTLCQHREIKKALILVK